MDVIDQFAKEALRFKEWAHTERREPGPAAREALVRISSLYLAALQLPSPFTNELGEQADVDRVSTQDLSRVRVNLGIPIEMYGKVYDPLPVPPDGSTIGSIADDIIEMLSQVFVPIKPATNPGRSGNGHLVFNIIGERMRRMPCARFRPG